MKTRLRLFVASLACLGVVAIGAAQSGAPREQAQIFTQRNETPPSWAIGNWAGRNDHTRSDVELQVGDNGRVMLTFRAGRSVQTLRGTYRRGRLDFGGEDYSIRERGDNLELTKDSDRRDSVVLRPTGNQDRGGGRGRDNDNDNDRGRGPLTIDSPKNNGRVPTGQVLFTGRSNGSEVEITINRGDRQVSHTQVSARNGYYETRINLPVGRYDATVRTRDRNRGSSERRVIFEVGGMGRTYIERPEAGERLDNGTVNITGRSEASEVQVEITRGRDRIGIEQVPVRNGRFSSRVTLSWGTYIVTVRAMEDGRVIGTDKRGFEVFGSPGNGGGGASDLRIDSPTGRDRFRDGSAEFSGTADASEVKIEVFRGRDRVASQTVSVRNGRFRTAIRLSEGRYEATITTEGGRGRNPVQRRVSFEMTR